MASNTGCERLDRYIRSGKMAGVKDFVKWFSQTKLSFTSPELGNHMGYVTIGPEILKAFVKDLEIKFLTEAGEYTPDKEIVVEPQNMNAPTVEMEVRHA